MEEQQASILSKLTSLEMLVGQCADWGIDTALDAHRRDGSEVKGLVDRGVGAYRRLIEASPKHCEKMRSGKNPGKNAQPLLHDYYRFPLRAGAVEQGEALVAECCSNFERSEVLERIVAAGPENWSPRGDSWSPKFKVPKECWAYTNYDLYYRPSPDQLVILDWKSGRITKESSAEAEAQLKVYALFGMHKLQLSADSIQTQAVWLRSNCSHEPVSHSKESLKAVRDQIVKQWKSEVESLIPGVNGRGESILFADRKDFPPEPDHGRCWRCKFRELCPEGQVTCGSRFALAETECEP